MIFESSSHTLNTSIYRVYVAATAWTESLHPRKASSGCHTPGGGRLNLSCCRDDNTFWLTSAKLLYTWLWLGNSTGSNSESSGSCCHNEAINLSLAHFASIRTTTTTVLQLSIIFIVVVVVVVPVVVYDLVRLLTWLRRTVLHCCTAAAVTVPKNSKSRNQRQPIAQCTLTHDGQDEVRQTLSFASSCCWIKFNLLNKHFAGKLIWKQKLPNGS